MSNLFFCYKASQKPLLLHLLQDTSSHICFLANACILLQDAEVLAGLQESSGKIYIHQQDFATFVQSLELPPSLASRLEQIDHQAMAQLMLQPTSSC